RISERQTGPGDGSGGARVGSAGEWVVAAQALRSKGQSAFHGGHEAGGTQACARVVRRGQQRAYEAGARREWPGALGPLGRAFRRPVERPADSEKQRRDGPPFGSVF